MAPCPPHLALLLVLAAALAGCGGGDNPRMLDPDTADALIAHIDRAEEAAGDDRCGRARGALRDAAAEVDGLGGEVAAGLRRNLADWVAHIRSELPNACEPREEPEETPTPTPTTPPPPEDTPTPEPTPSPTPEPTPSPTPDATPPPDDDDDDDDSANSGGGNSGNGGGTGGGTGGGVGNTGGTPPGGGSG